MSTKKILLEGFIGFLRKKIEEDDLQNNSKFSFFIISLILSYTFLFSQTNTGWNWQNPIPTGNNLFAIKFINSNTGIAVGECGTVIRTTDGGSTWNKLTISNFDCSNFKSICFATQNPNIGYIVGENNAGGATHNPIKTTNGGISWFDVTNINMNLRSVFLLSNSIVWITSSGGRVYYSMNGGTNWAYVQVGGLYQDMMCIYFIDSLTAWSAGQDGIIYKSTNGGFNWISQLSPSSNWWHSVYFINNSTGFIAGYTGKIIKTTNGGVNWINKPTGTTNDLYSIFFVDTNNIFVTGISGTLVKSTNTGENWSIINTGFNTLLGIYFQSAALGFSVGSNGEIIKTTNGGNNWFRPFFRVTNNYLRTTKFIDANTGWVAGDYGNIFKTTNGGTNWINQTYDTITQFNTLHVCDSNILYAVGNYGRIIKSTNGGNNWISQTSGVTGVLKSINFYGNSNGWISGDGGVLLKTTNGGNNWLTLTSGVIKHLNYIQFVNLLTGWTLGQDKTILKSTNGGDNWFAQSIGLPSTRWIQSGFFLDTLYGWLTADNSNLGFTTDGGITWGYQKGGNEKVPGNLWTVRFINKYTGWITSSTGAIAKTTTGGWSPTSWYEFPYFTYHGIYSIYPVNSNIVYAVGEGGMILKTITGGENYYPTITIMKNNILKPIMYNQTLKDTIEISVDIPNETNLIYDINVAIDTLINNVDSGLVFILYHQGIYDTLIYRAGGAGNNFVKTILNDSAATSIQNGTPPFTGQFRPFRPLSQFYNQSVNGNWILMIYEGANKMEKTGVIKSWGITVSYRFTSGMINNTERILKDFKLYQNYPNPFNPSTRIKYKLVNNSYVTLKIYDILGKEIATLVNGSQKPGIYELPFSNVQLSSGIYFYRLVTDNYTETRKMVMLK